MSAIAERIPVNVITGFLGSGKTTLLKRLLTLPGLEHTAVLVNEIGEVGLDHHLLRQVDERTVLMRNGCLCCSIRGDLAEALRGLLSQSQREEITSVRRVVVETSGLADPVPIAYTVLTEPVLQHHFRLGTVVTTVDAVNSPGQLARYPESVKQVAIADRLVITKTDLAEPGRVETLRRELTRINPSAEMLLAPHQAGDAAQILIRDAYSEQGREREIQGWLEGAARAAPSPAEPSHGGITSITLRFPEALDWSAFGVWLTLLLHCHGQQVLRVKGLLTVRGESTPVVIQGVQHIVHPPTHLEAWPDDERISRLVFIVDGLDGERLRNSLDTFNALASRL